MRRAKHRGSVARLHDLLTTPGVSDSHHYARRVMWLAIVQVAVLLAALAGIVLLLWHAEFFVTLAQRSNVETLTIAFLLVLYGYFAIATAPGARGAVRIAWHRIRGDEAKQMRALGERGDGATAAFDKAVVLEGAPHDAWEIEIRDDVGSMGRLRFEGVRVQQVDTFRNGSNTLLGYVEHKIGELTKADIAIVQWGSTNDEELRQLSAVAVALRATWPTVTLTLALRDSLERELGELCRALRNELFLPDWEYSVEHKLPIIPEPLGIISLSRSEKRVDPLASLVSALVVILVVLGLTILFIVRPPWIPGR